MLRHKNTINISDLKDFFTSSEKVISKLFSLLSSLTVSLSDVFAHNDKPNTLYRGVNKLMVLVLFPFFEIKNTGDYQSSVLHQFLGGGKDLFYRLLNDEDMAWRKLLYRMNVRLINRVKRRTGISQDERCLIVDDTDLPKRGRQMELIGKIYSHVTHTFNLGFKGLFLGYHDGGSFYGLDFSLHGEKGKNEKKPYGLTKKELKGRYGKTRAKGSCGYERKEEYFRSKIGQLIVMVRGAIGKGIRFDYLLADSWFTCFELIHFIKTRRIGCHFIGMIKMGNTHYAYNGKSLTSKEIAADLNKKRKARHSKKLKCYYSEACVDFKGHEVKLFFCRYSKRAKWNGLLSTNTALNFEDAYRIYSKRWTIEVFFKECKQYLRLGKCQSQDFDAQIASASICVMQYNLLAVIKRFEGYETMGELFRKAQADTLELTVCDRIWQIIIELLSELAIIFDLEYELLMEKMLSENEQLTKIANLEIRTQTG